MTRLVYWDDRYARQGIKTVGCSSFSSEKFEKKSIEAFNLLSGFILDHDLKGSKALDFGCGIGRLTGVLVSSYKDVYGIDIIEWAIKEAEKRCGKAEFKIFDGERIPFDDLFFDLVVCWTVLQHIPPEEIVGICREIARVVSEKGKVILYENVSTYLSDKEHIWFRDDLVYRGLFPDFSCINSRLIEGFDGNIENHSLMLLKKVG
jgi:ubiquinone/menaquinone biosynthesis C-methylase UbiE